MREIVAVLYNIRSLHNVGSIFRTADAAGISKLYLVGITPSPTDRFGKIRPQISKVALGAEKTVPWEKVDIKKEEEKLIKNLKKDGYKALALEQSKKSIPYYKLPPTHYKFKKIALIIGNEVRGLPKKILKSADKIIEIPMRGNKESLNVSVAFGIAVFRLLY